MDQEGLECAICCEVMKNPVSLDPCGHSFCKICAEKWREQTSMCAMCKMNCKGLLPNITLRQIISSFLEKPNQTPSFKYCDDCSKSKQYFVEINISECFVPCDFCIGLIIFC